MTDMAQEASDRCFIGYAKSAQLRVKNIAVVHIETKILTEVGRKSPIQKLFCHKVLFSKIKTGVMRYVSIEKSK